MIPNGNESLRVKYTVHANADTDHPQSAGLQYKKPFEDNKSDHESTGANMLGEKKTDTSVSLFDIKKGSQE